MARAKPRTPATAVDGVPVLPLALLEPRSAAGAHERRQWLRAHGIDPGDWSAFYAVLKASAAAHGKPLAMDRARDRIRPSNPVSPRRNLTTKEHHS